MLFIFYIVIPTERSEWSESLLGYAPCDCYAILVGMTLLRLADDKVYQTTFDDNALSYRLPFEKGSDFFARADKRLNFFVRKALRYHHLRLDLAVDLNGVFYFVFHKCAFVYQGIAFFKDGGLMSALFPKLFRKVGRKGRDHTDEVFRARFVERNVLVFYFRFIFLHCVDVFHQSCHRGVERERLDIAGDILQCVMLRVVEFLFRFRRFVRLLGICFQVDRFSYDTFDAVGEFRNRLDTVVVPRSAFGIAETEHQIQTEHIRAVFFDIGIGGNDVAVRFRHTVAVRSQDNALVNEAFEGLVKVDIAHIAQRFGNETRVQQVHTSVFATANVNVYGEHLIRNFRREGRFVVASFGITKVIPAGAHEGVEGIGVTGSFAAALRARAVHKSCVRSKRGFSRRTEFYVVGELYGQILFRNGNGAAFSQYTIGIGAPQYL